MSSFPAGSPALARPYRYRYHAEPKSGTVQRTGRKIEIRKRNLNFWNKHTAQYNMSTRISTKISLYIPAQARTLGLAACPKPHVPAHRSIITTKQRASTPNSRTEKPHRWTQRAPSPAACCYFVHVCLFLGCDDAFVHNLEDF